MPAPRIASRSTRPASASRYGDARSSVSTAPPAFLGTGRSRARAMASHVAGVALPPNEDFTFTPFQSGGLCEAVRGDVPRGAGRGDGPVRQKDAEAMRGEERRALGGELRREEAGVEYDRERPRISRFEVRLVDRPRGGRSHDAANAVEREIAGDPAPPAVGAEDDGRLFHGTADSRGAHRDCPAGARRATTGYGY